MKNYKIIQISFSSFVVMLALSGLTAIPIDTKLSCKLHFISLDTSIYQWLLKVSTSFMQVSGEHRFLLNGYIWLAFTLLVPGILFINFYKNPVKSNWFTAFGLIACLLLLPLALIADSSRDTLMTEDFWIIHSAYLTRFLY